MSTAVIEILLAVGTFTGIILVLSILVLEARRRLAPSGRCAVVINDRTTIQVPAGQRLLAALTGADIHLPTACGGAGTCGLCKVRVLDGGGEPLPQELGLMSRAEARQGVRLSCQVPVLATMTVEVDEVYLSVKTWQCTVVSVRNMATLISEIVLQIPGGESLDCRPGSFVQVTCPPYQLDYSDIEVDSRFNEGWQQAGLRALHAGTPQPVTRAYSLASSPGEPDRVALNIRIALPPPHSPQIPPGIVSSWLFSLKPGDQVEISGPYGAFYVRDTEKEAVFIGGGVGMAPLYAQIRHLLEVQQSKRTISYWYGARSGSEIYYDDIFEQLQKTHDNFSWHPALSAPAPEDNWQGATGFIHQVIHDQYLATHPAPEDCEYYLCGPPLMVKAVRAMLDNLGVDSEDIHFDDFGNG
jgi:Na+-transporting NADH:ubiquinone oxidoreductase subunit F